MRENLRQLAIGNVTKDNLNNTFTYDMEGRAFSINGNGVTYDAFNRAVEVQTGSSSYQQIVYSPSGQKFAFMNGTAVVNYTVPMPAGVQAVYNPSGLWYYRFADWLGTSRFGATPSGGMQYSLASAPFGETYAQGGSVSRSFTGQTQDTVAGSTDCTTSNSASRRVAGTLAGARSRWPRRRRPHQPPDLEPLCLRGQQPAEQYRSARPRNHM